MSNFKLLCALSFLIITAISCKKDRNDVLPAATREGKNTFGCLVDGKAFLPKGSGITSSSKLKVEINSWIEGKFITSIIATNVSDCGSSAINIGLLGTKVVQNVTYKLALLENGNPGAQYIGTNFCKSKTADTYSSNNTADGEIIFSNLDTINHIAAGTFWFDAVSEDGKRIEIRDGRFDVKLN